MIVSRLLWKTLLKLTVLFLLLAVATTLTSGWTLRSRLTEEFRSKGQAISNSVANAAVDVIISRDASSVQALIDQYGEIAGVGYVFVTDSDGQIIAHTFVPTIPENVLPLTPNQRSAAIQEIKIQGSGNHIDISSPMLAGLAGTVHVGMNRDVIEAHIRDAQRTLLLVLAVVFLVGVASAYFVIGRMTGPVGEAARVARAVSAGDLTVRIQSRSKDETGELIRSINRMTESLNGIAGKMQTSGSDLVTIAARVATNSRRMDAAMQELGAFTGDTLVSSTQISNTSQQLFRTMDDLSRLAEDSALLAAVGKEGLGRMENTVARLVDLTAQLSGSFAEMKEKTNSIGMVTTAMTKVADRTNLLSLNAAIEAEKAGVQGAGFSVVAREIRRLADQTAVSTLEIEKIVSGIQSAVSNGVDMVRNFSDEVRLSESEIRNAAQQLSQIVEKVQALSPRFEAVTQGTLSQSEGAESIHRSMILLNETAEKTARSVDEFQEITIRLEDAARILQNEVSRFRTAG